MEVFPYMIYSQILWMCRIISKVFTLKILIKVNGWIFREADPSREISFLKNFTAGTGCKFLGR